MSKIRERIERSSTRNKAFNLTHINHYLDQAVLTLILTDEGWSEEASQYANRELKKLKKRLQRSPRYGN